jgi:HTH-type transcriptional regulator / antitoxin HipB
MDHIAGMVRFHRRESGLTQKELADLAGVGVSSIYAIEQGRESVQLATLLKVLAVLSISLTVEGPLSERSRRRVAEQQGAYGIAGDEAARGKQRGEQP